LAGRFAAALALTIAYYVLAIGLAAGLLALAILPWVWERGNPFVSIIGLVLGCTVLVAIAPRRGPFTPPGVAVSRDDQPALIGVIDACCPSPADAVYVTFDVGAAVVSLGRRRHAVVLGLPLLQLVTERGLRAVIAQASYAGGDTRLGRWVHRTRDRVARTIAARHDDEPWTQTLVRMPFLWYGRVFLRVTTAIARREVLAADVFAARHAGRDVQVETLRQVHAFAPAFDAYWANEVAPLLAVGRRPPVGEGFGAFVRAPAIADAAGVRLRLALEQGGTDSQPSLTERIAAVQDCPPGEPDLSGVAAALVSDPLALEAAQATHLFGPGAGNLQPVGWHAVGAEVYLERARRLVDAHGELLGDATAGDLDAMVDRLGHVAGALQRREPDLEVEHARDFAAALMADGLLVALSEHGWSVEAPPAEPVVCRRGADAVPPHAVVHELREGRLTGTAWRDRADALGIARLALRPVSAPA
jgi:Zn-dependent protease with chaperone function